MRKDDRNEDLDHADGRRAGWNQDQAGGVLPPVQGDVSRDDGEVVKLTSSGCSIDSMPFSEPIRVRFTDLELTLVQHPESYLREFIIRKVDAAVKTELTRP